MPLKPDRTWVFWSGILTILALVLFNVTFFPTPEPGEHSSRASIGEMAPAAEVSTAPEEDKIVIDAKAAIDFTKKAACRHNVQVINTMVELWYVQHDGQWPKDDLSDIGRDKDYFPNGIPKCPVTGRSYKLDPEIKRVLGHDHDEIYDPTQKQDDFEYSAE